MKKNLFNKILLSGALLLVPTIVNAESANIAITGESTANVNDTVTLNVKVNNIDDASIVAVGGDIFYNPEYLTLIDTKSVSTNYKFDGNQIKNGNYRIAGVDYTMENGINVDSVVYSLVFKANKVGTTEVSFKNAELVNTNAKVINSTTTSKVLNIIEKETINNNVVVSNTTNEVINTKEEVKSNVVVKNNAVVNNVITNNNINEVVFNNDVINNSEIVIIDRLNPVKFDKEINGLTINEVVTYSIYNYKKEK